MEEFSLIYWDSNYNRILFLNILIIIALFTSLRFLSGALAHINSSKELADKDNAAFGISIAGVVFAITIILTGVIYGDPIYTLEDSVISVGLYGVLGVMLMAATRVIFDKIAVPSVPIQKQIIEGNVSAAIIDAGNVIATAIIIRTMMIWVEFHTIEGLLAVFTGFLISQVLLTVTTLIRIKKLNMQIKSDSFQEEIKSDNRALALRFSGRKIGSAFAVTAASNLMVFELYDIQMLLFIWAVISVVMIAALGALSWIATRVILAKIDIEDEVIRQRNMALGALQFAVYVCMGVLLAELVA